MPQLGEARLPDRGLEAPVRAALVASVRVEEFMRLDHDVGGVVVEQVAVRVAVGLGRQHDGRVLQRHRDPPVKVGDQLHVHVLGQVA